MAAGSALGACIALVRRKYNDHHKSKQRRGSHTAPSQIPQHPTRHMKKNKAQGQVLAASCLSSECLYVTLLPELDFGVQLEMSALSSRNSMPSTTGSHWKLLSEEKRDRWKTHFFWCCCCLLFWLRFLIAEANSAGETLHDAWHCWHAPPRGKGGAGNSNAAWERCVPNPPRAATSQRTCMKR